MTYWDVSKSLHSDAHYDDHLAVRFFDDEHSTGVAVIADGVSNSAGGRIAALVACLVIPEFIQNNRNDVIYSDPFALIEAALEEAGAELLDVGKRVFDAGLDGIRNILKEIDPPEIREKFVEKIRPKVEEKRKKGNIPDFESTAIIAYFVGSKIYVALVGDGSMLEMRDGTMYPYPQSRGSLNTFLSSKDGYQGPARKLHIRLPKGGTFVLGSDGCQIRYSGEHGAPYALFQNTFRRSLEEGGFDSFAERYYEQLKKQEKKRNVKILDDDFSLIALHLVETPPSSDSIGEGGLEMENVIDKSVEEIESIYRNMGKAIAERVYKEISEQAETAFNEKQEEIESQLPRRIQESIERETKKAAQIAADQMTEEIQKRIKVLSYQLPRSLLKEEITESKPFLESIEKEIDPILTEFVERIEEHSRKSVREAFQEEIPKIGADLKDPVENIMVRMIHSKVDEFTAEIPKILEEELSKEEISKQFDKQLQPLANDFRSNLEKAAQDAIEKASDQNKTKLDNQVQRLRRDMKKQAKLAFDDFAEKSEKSITEIFNKNKANLKEYTESVTENLEKQAEQAISEAYDKQKTRISQEVVSIRTGIEQEATEFFKDLIEPLQDEIRETAKKQLREAGGQVKEDILLDVEKTTSKIIAEKLKETSDALQE
ncbi:MAG: hypothetical protein GF309_02160 [Candidatus Lokiarchaeota archaeon]|nr:hypothetical protein [Candidatus Lokiarchaeota archaeon]